MKIKAGRWLVLPINNNSAERIVTINSADAKYTLRAALDAKNPAYHSYVPLIRFGEGASLEINLAEGEFSLSDSLPSGLYTERLRPQVRFSPRLGWTNDPNGLVYYKGLYHLFFQHNPAGNKWNNMHWGHAVSADLLHWTERDIALYPDSFGTMFSGSAIIDHNNVTGLKTGDDDVMLLYYTAAGQPFTQCMAYSPDGGETFIKYTKNPAVPHIAGDNRDPKVIYCGELDCHIMALYLEGNTYALLRSDNLLDWSELQRFALPGDGECPDFYPLECEGVRYWVFSGASDRYFIGGFEGGIFMPIQEAKALHGEATTFYAAQTYSDARGGRRIRLSWDTAQTAADGGMPFNCSMSVPAEMKIIKKDGGLFLCAYPIAEFASLRKSGTYDPASKEACDIETELIPRAGAAFSVFGRREPLPEAFISGGAPVKVRIIADRTGYEAYFGEGESYLSRGGECDYNKPPFEAENADINSLSVFGLNSIWAAE